MLKLQHVSVKRHERQRWLSLALVLLALGLIVSGCGGGQSAPRPISDSGAAAAAQKIEAAVERVEAAAARAEAAAEKAEAAVARAEAIPQQTEVEVAVQPAETTAEPAEETAATEEVAAPVDTEAIKIGVIATLTGTFTILGEDGVRGVEQAVAEFGGEINGRPIEVITESSDAAKPDVALNAARKLIEEEGVDIVVGPLSGDEGLIVREYAKDHPDKTFVNGTSGAQDTTLRDPAPNFFRFSTDGAQWMAGLGSYAYEEKGYHRVVTVAEDYSYPYSQVGGFLVDFCQAGGEVVQKYWIPIGTTDYSEVVASIPTDIDAIYVALGGSDSLDFLAQYGEAGGTAPLIGGSITLDQTILGAEGELADFVLGTPAAGPVADDNPDEAWQAFVADYQGMFPDGLPSPSLFAHGYYVNAKAALLALEQVSGDLSNGQQAFQESLRNLEFDSPTGPIRVDENRQAIASNFITEVARDEDGNLYNKFVKEVKNVNQTLGVDREAYLELGSLTRDNPLCEDIQALSMDQ